MSAADVKVIRTRRLRDGRRFIQAWCAKCGLMRWISNGALGECPCATERGGDR